MANPKPFKPYKPFAPPPQAQLGTPSPCVRLCTLNEQDICVGCGRTLDDIKAWSTMSEPDKAQCVARAEQTRATLAHPWSSAAVRGKP